MVPVLSTIVNFVIFSHFCPPPMCIIFLFPPSPTPLLCQSAEYSSSGYYVEAVQYGRWALSCNIAAISYSVIAFFVYMAVAIGVGVAQSSSDDY